MAVFKYKDPVTKEWKKVIGGGGGGLLPQIIITGLSSACTVTATKDGKTIPSESIFEHINSPEEIPAMTSNTSPEGECNASSNNSGRQPWHAFDGTFTTTNTSYWQSNAKPTTTNPQWLQYKFEKSVCVNQMVYKALVNDNSRVRDCVVQCSDNGVDFVDVYTTNLNPSSEEVTVTFENTIYAKYWRLKILSNNGNSSNVYVPSLQFKATGYMVGGHVISQIDSFGTWTVTATNGAQTVTQDVLIDVIARYEIEMEL